MQGLADYRKYARSQDANFSCVMFELAEFHELPTLLIFGCGLQIIIYLIILASKARHANLIDTTGGRGRLVCLAL